MGLVKSPLVPTEISMSLYYRSESKASTSSSSLSLYISSLSILPSSTSTLTVYKLYYQNENEKGVDRRAGILNFDICTEGNYHK